MALCSLLQRVGELFLTEVKGHLNWRRQGCYEVLNATGDDDRLQSDNSENVE